MTFLNILTAEISLCWATTNGFVFADLFFLLSYNILAPCNRLKCATAILFHPFCPCWNNIFCQSEVLDCRNPVRATGFILKQGRKSLTALRVKLPGSWGASPSTRSHNRGVDLLQLQPVGEIPLQLQHKTKIWKTKWEQFTTFFPLPRHSARSFDNFCPLELHEILKTKVTGNLRILFTDWILMGHVSII